MSKVYSAFKCDCCGDIHEGDPGDGVYLILEGNPRWLSLAKEKYEFPDICGTCQRRFYAAIRDAAKSRGYQLPPRPLIQCAAPPPESAATADDTK